MRLKNRLGDIQPDYANLLHGRLHQVVLLIPLLWHTDAVWGRPPHQTCHSRLVDQCVVERRREREAGSWHADYLPRANVAGTAEAVAAAREELTHQRRVESRRVVAPLLPDLEEIPEETENRKPQMSDAGSGDDQT